MFLANAHITEIISDDVVAIELYELEWNYPFYKTNE